MISKRWIKVKVEGITSNRQTDLEIPLEGVLCITLFLVAINGILGELENKVDRSLFVDDLVIYIATRKQSLATLKLQGVTKNGNHKIITQ